MSKLKDILEKLFKTHMKEMGQMKKNVYDFGFIRLATVEGWYDQTLLSQKVINSDKNEQINGVIGSKPLNKIYAEEMKKPIKADDTFKDINVKTSSFGLNPNAAIPADVIISKDHPGIDKKDASINTGKEPYVHVLIESGCGLITPKGLLKWLYEAANRNNIPSQIDIFSGGTIDATAIFLARDGIPLGGISL